LDTTDRTEIVANVSYPFLLTDDDGNINPAAAVNPAAFLGSADSWSYVNDGTAGFSSNLFNSWITTAADGAKTGAGASLGVMVYVNTSEARVRSGARINQATDAIYRDGN